MPTARICLCQSVILKSKMFYTYRILDSFAHWGEHKEKKKVLSHASSPSFFHEFFRNYTVASKANYSAPHFGRTPFVKNFPVLSQHAAAAASCCCHCILLLASELVNWLAGCRLTVGALVHLSIMSKEYKMLSSHTIIF